MIQVNLIPHPLLVIGLIIVLAVISGEVQRRLGIPQVLGFIIIGIILGPVFFGLIDETLLTLSPIITAIALGFIGYNIGNEFRISTVKKEARKLLPILVAETIGTYFLVFFVILFWLRDPLLAILLGSLAAATAPAATADIIWEFKSKGPVTDSLMFILIMDDVIAIILTSIAISVVVLFLNPLSVTLFQIIATPAIDIGVSLLIGAGFGFLLAHFLQNVKDHGRYILLLISVILLIIGIAELLQASYLLTCMVFGIVLSNRVPKESIELGNEAEKILSPFILLFFVFFGAGMIDPTLFITGGILVVTTAILYVIARTVGKYFSTRLAAKASENPPTVVRYLGLCLFSQAGVAVGLSVVIADYMAQLGAPQYATIIVGVIGLSTLIFQLFGPLAVKTAIHRAGEVNSENNHEVQESSETVDTRARQEDLSFDENTEPTSRSE
ncbi:MAG: cation:proton antiporter [Candidatus Hodarchaeota archaeon]